MTDHLHVEPHLAIPGVDPELLRVRKVTATERVSRPYDVWVEFVALETDPLEDKLECGKRVKVELTREGEVVRTFHGIVAEIEDALETETKHDHFRVRVVPRLHRLTLVKKQAIYLDLSVPEIVSSKLEQLGFAAGRDFELRLSATYPKREFVTQYKETDLAFVSRLLEHLGITYFFEQTEQGDRVVLTDHGPGFGEVAEPIGFRGRGDRRDVFDIDAHRTLTPEHHIVGDYNWRKPLLDLTSVAKVDRRGVAGGVVEYGTHVKDPDEAELLAKVRAGEADGARHAYRGKSDRASFAPGFRVALEGHKRIGDAKLLLTEVHHHAAQPLSGKVDDGHLSYENRFRAVAADVDFRPPRETPAPRIHGVVNGVVEGGDAGGSPVMDEQGRYWVRFAFDIEGQDGGARSSRPIRMAQPHAGAGYGVHFPIRPGTEVLVAFVDGDPDRPIILGTVPNPVTASPVTNANHKINKIKSASGVTLEFYDGDE